MPISKAEKLKLMECVVTDGTIEGRKKYVKSMLTGLKEQGFTEDQVTGWAREVYQEHD